MAFDRSSHDLRKGSGYFYSWDITGQDVLPNERRESWEYSSQREYRNNFNVQNDLASPIWDQELYEERPSTRKITLAETPDSLVSPHIRPLYKSRSINNDDLVTPTSIPHISPVLPPYYHPGSSVCFSSSMSDTEIGYHYCEGEIDIITAHSTHPFSFKKDICGLSLQSAYDRTLSNFSYNHYSSQHRHSNKSGEARQSMLKNSDELSKNGDNNKEESNISQRKINNQNNRHKNAYTFIQKVFEQNHHSLDVNDQKGLVGNFEEQITRPFICNFTTMPDCFAKRCKLAFMRPEHLRRHLRTVHSNNKNFYCKIPFCKKFFSRSDNLRDHYWTHLERGGRHSKNQKMTLSELEKVLGSGQGKLVQRLRKKLQAYCEKVKRK